MKRAALAVLLLACTVARAQASTLTTAQLQTLKADLLAGSFTCEQPNQEVADAYNLPASPDYWVWRTRVTKDEYVNETSVDGTNFAWTGAGFITRSQGERDAFSQLFMNNARAVNPSRANVRQAFQDIFSGGTSPAPANRTHLATVSRRKATRAEKLFAAGTGSTASPATLGWESPAGTATGSVLTSSDVSEACNQP